MATWRLLLTGLMACMFVLTPAPAAHAQQDGAREEETEAPGFRRPKPDFAGLEQLRFMTDSDYPPFNYLDEEGALTGFNVDLARALCDVLAVECDVRAIDWNNLMPALDNGDADAVIASIRPSQSTLARLDFSDPYYHTPARFAAIKDTGPQKTTPAALKAKKIAVVGATSHEAFLKDFYPESEILIFKQPDQAREALRKGEVDLLFGDAISIMFWLNGTSSQNCCEFRGGAYADSRYFGEGIGIAMRRGNRKLRVILDYGLAQLRDAGRLEELYLRYFPLSFF